MTTRTITGLFDSRAEADRAVADLVQKLGLARDQVSVVAQDASAGTAAGTTTRPEERGFWASLGDLFMPTEDRYAYSEGISRGGVLVSAKVDDAKLEQAMDVLEAHGAVDLDQREQEWRSQGWQGYAGAAGTGAVLGAVSDGTRTGVAAMPGTSAPDGTPGNPPGTMLSRGVDQVAGTNISGAHPENETGRTGVAGGPARTDAARTDAAHEAIPIAEERLRVGKREANRGRVRVRSYVVETPVEEQVRLREEHVRVERRAADRPVGADASALFQERVIEATESTEEAVVQKDAVVTGEVVVRKEAEERVETIKDTVRRTEVEVEDERARSANVNLPGDTKRRGA